MTIQCKCGFRVEGIETKIAAEVLADRHESADVRHSSSRHGQRRGTQYVGDTTIVADIYWLAYAQASKEIN